MNEPTTYGLYDTTDNCWIGNTKGPLTYTDKVLAEVAARIANARLCWSPLRIRAVEFKEDQLRLKDTLKPKRTAERAIDLLERGAIL